MRELKRLFLIVLVLTFLGGIGMGAWIGALVAATPPAPRTSVDLRIRDFQRHFDLDATQIRQLRTLLVEHDEKDKKLRQLTPEQWKEVRGLERATIERIKGILTPGQLRDYDSLLNRK